MTEMTNYQLFDLINRPSPLWLVKANFEGADLRNAILYDANMKNVTMPDGSIRE